MTVVVVTKWKKNRFPLEYEAGDDVPSSSSLEETTWWRLNVRSSVRWTWSSFIRSINDDDNLVDSNLIFNKNEAEHFKYKVISFYIYSRLYIRRSDGKLRHLIIGFDSLMRFDDFASLATASHVSRTGGKLGTRNARLNASKSEQRRKSERYRFHFSVE
jgi:hypothetical protein